MQDRQYRTTEMPLTNINVFWLEGAGYDITIGEDAHGNPYIKIAINRIGSHMKLQEISNTWRGKIIKIIGADRAPALAENQKAAGASGRARMPLETDLADPPCAR